MRFITLLRKRSRDTQIPLIQRDFYIKLATYVAKLEDAAVKSMKTHDVICDSSRGECNCGADDANRAIHNLLQDGEMDAGQRSYR